LAYLKAVEIYKQTDAASNATSSPGIEQGDGEAIDAAKLSSSSSSSTISTISSTSAAYRTMQSLKREQQMIESLRTESQRQLATRVGSDSSEPMGDGRAELDSSVELLSPDEHDGEMILEQQTPMDDDGNESGNRKGSRQWKRKKSDPNAPKRALTPFIFFTIDMRAKLDPQMKRQVRPTEITTQIAQQWNSLGDEDRAVRESKNIEQRMKASRIPFLPPPLLIALCSIVEGRWRTLSTTNEQLHSLTK
jgi:hypothetical protein